MAKTFKHPLTIFASFFVLLWLFSLLGVKLPVSVITQEKGQPLVVEGVGKVSVVADMAKITLGVEESGTSLKAVQDSVNSKSKKIKEELKRIGIEEKDIKTVSYSVYPSYDYSNFSVPRITGYRVSTSYEVGVNDFEKINGVVSISTSAGANMMGDISFEVNEDTKNRLLDQARAEAVSKAKEKALSLSTAAGVSLGKILNISEAEGSKTPESFALRDLPDAGGGVEQPDISPGETQIEVTVFISYEIH